MRNFVFMMSIAAAILIGMTQGPREEMADQYGNLLPDCNEKVSIGNCNDIVGNPTGCPGYYKAMEAIPASAYRDGIYLQGTESYCTDPKCEVSLGPAAVIGESPGDCNPTWDE